MITVNLILSDFNWYFSVILYTAELNYVFDRLFLFLPSSEYSACVHLVKVRHFKLYSIMYFMEVQERVLESS